jgi:hypothetical protein
MNILIAIHKDELPPLLSQLGGGFYMGQLHHDGKPHALIRAPKAVGHFTEVSWGLRGQKIDGASSVVDGRANTIAMAEAGSELAQAILKLNIGGAEDWALPARDQLEIMYRNAKPTEEENYCSWRDGDNPNSIPPGQLYTEESPAQVADALFQDGGGEAFDDGWYLTSTQYSANVAYGQTFNGGFQGDIDEGYELRAFAVRMIPIIN